MAEVTVLKEDLPAFTDILQIALGFRIPWIGIWFHQTTHTLLNNVGIRIFLVVLAFWIHAIGILRGLENERSAMDLGAGWWSRVNCSQLDRFIKIWQE